MLNSVVSVEWRKCVYNQYCGVPKGPKWRGMGRLRNKKCCKYLLVTRQNTSRLMLLCSLSNQREGNESKHSRWLHHVGFNISQNLISPYATNTFPIMHLICPPKFYISIVFNSSWDGCITHEKGKTKVMHLPCTCQTLIIRISQKPNLIIVLLHIVLKKVTTNTPSQGTWIDVVIGNHALRAQISKLSASR